MATTVEKSNSVRVDLSKYELDTAGLIVNVADFLVGYNQARGIETVSSDAVYDINGGKKLTEESASFLLINFCNGYLPKYAVDNVIKALQAGPLKGERSDARYGSKDLKGTKGTVRSFMAYPIRPAKAQDLMYYGMMSEETLFTKIAYSSDQIIRDTVMLAIQMVNDVEAYLEKGYPSLNLSFDDIMDKLKVLPNPNKGIESQEFEDLLNHLEDPLIREDLSDYGIVKKLNGSTVGILPFNSKTVMQHFKKNSLLVRSIIKTIYLSQMAVTDSNYRSATRVFLGGGRGPDPMYVLKLMESSLQGTKNRDEIRIRDMGDFGSLVLLTAAALPRRVKTIRFYSDYQDARTVLAEMIKRARPGFLYSTDPNIRKSVPQRQANISFEEAHSANLVSFSARFGKTDLAFVCAREVISNEADGSSYKTLNSKYDAYCRSTAADPANVTTLLSGGMTSPHYDANISAYPQFYIFTRGLDIKEIGDWVV